MNKLAPVRWTPPTISCILKTQTTSRQEAKTHMLWFSARHSLSYTPKTSDATKNGSQKKKNLFSGFLDKPKKTS